MSTNWISYENTEKPGFWEAVLHYLKDTFKLQSRIFKTIRTLTLVSCIHGTIANCSQVAPRSDLEQVLGYAFAFQPCLSIWPWRDTSCLYFTVESLDQHGSVITHLLSQVRIGMDLTKIVLPTFILEKRSLLEMYADFLAHPDLFVGWVNHNNLLRQHLHPVHEYCLSVCLSVS